MLRAIVCLLLVTPVLWAQGRKETPVFDEPEQEVPAPEAARNRAKEALDRTIQRLSGWPTERARRAAERLIVQKEKTLPLMVQILISAEPKMDSLKPGAAYVLGRIGHREQYMMLLHVVVEKKQQKHAATFLEAAWRLNEKEAVAEAFRFFRLSETRLRRGAVKFVLDRVTAENLEQVRALLDRRTAERAFTREIGLRLLDRLVETRKVKWDDVADRFYRALGDESPQVSSRAMRLLAAHNNEQNIKTLNDLITRKMSYWRHRSYAALALAILGFTYKEQPFSEESIALLRGPKGMGHRETLAKASAAIALTTVALRTNDKQLVRLLDREIPIVLIDSVGARRHHYRDFGTVMPIAYTVLRRITGETLPDHAPAWARWWRDNHRNFRAKRELVVLEESDLRSTIVEITPPARSKGKRRRFVVVGKDQPTFRYGYAYALTLGEMARYVELLRGMRFFDIPETLETADRDAAQVVVRVGDLNRTVAYHGTEAGKPNRDRILAMADNLAEDKAWEMFWDVEQYESWELFFLEHHKWFQVHTDPAERAAKLRSMIAASLNDLVSADLRLYAAEYAARLPGGGKALTRDQVKAFVDAVTGEAEVNPFVVAVIDLLVPAAGRESADLLINALAAKTGVREQRLLASLCSQLEEGHIASLARDPRWKVRRAAVTALANRDDTRIARTVLRARLADEEVGVRVAAAEVLARRKEAEVLPVLKALRDNPSPSVRESVAYAYGLLGGQAGVAGARRLLFKDPHPAVRVRAIQGLVDGRDPAAAAGLVDLFVHETDVSVRAAAASGLVKLETPKLVSELIERLELTAGGDPERVALVNVLARFQSVEVRDTLQNVLQGDDQMSADAAALGLARRWDETALLQLIRMVRRGGGGARTAVRHLQMLTSFAVESERYQRQAENYDGWLQKYTEGNPRTWYVEALSDHGYDVSAFREFADARGTTLPAIHDDMVVVLLSALRDKDWFIVRNASFLLNQRMGAGAPNVISYSSSKAEAEGAIAVYNDWWATYTEKKKAEDRG